MNSQRDDEVTAGRTRQILRDYQRQISCRTDTLFAGLMLLQWLAGIAAALWLTPYTWTGARASVHFHVWLAFFFGGLLCSLPLVLVWRRPGEAVTRYAIALCQMLFSSLLIHLCGGRIETHFHVFGSLAFLAAYRDWRVLLIATVVVAGDHFLRGTFWPETIFGIAGGSPWRWAEHAAWVLFEDLFLFVSVCQSAKEMRNVAQQTARLENHSELKSYSERLARSVEMERAVIDCALDAIVRIDRVGRISSWNTQAEQVFGWTADEAVGQLVHDLIVPAPQRAAHVAGLRRYLETGRGSILNHRLELEAVHRDGHLFPIEIAITPVHQGKDLLFCAFVRDITARKSSERELRHAIEQAQGANCAKSAFLANMSHEIRTPLNAILGFTEILRRRAGSPEQHAEYLETIHSSGQHLLTLINDILDLSKVEAGRMECERVECSPCEILAEVLSLTRVRAREKGIALECQWVGGAPETIRTDPDRLRQLLMNLVSNAIKFTDHGGVTVTVGIESREAQPRLAIEVRDSGIGIRAEHLERIFSPFDQADTSITRRFGGTGLGLAISRNIARQLGGDITVQSVLGQGSTFRATLETGSLDGVRFFSDPPSELLARRQRQTGKERVRASLHGVRILVVDDGDTNRDLITVLLQDAGATVVCAADGQQGIEAARREPFDLILMDMQMPIVDGYTATGLLRAEGYTLPIIALTAHAMRGDEAKCCQAGCSGYLVKPIDIDSLLDTIGDALSSRSPAPTIQATAAASRDSGAGPAIRSTLPTQRPEFQLIVENFVDKLAIKLDEMQRALAQNDWKGLAELAHWLKGTGGTVGFPCFTEPAHELECAARQVADTASQAGLARLTALAQRITTHV